MDTMIDFSEVKQVHTLYNTKVLLSRVTPQPRKHDNQLFFQQKFPYIIEDVCN